MSDFCESFGACCATPRVSFHRSHLDSEPGGYVPAALASTCRIRGADSKCQAMRGAGRQAG